MRRSHWLLAAAVLVGLAVAWTPTAAEAVPAIRVTVTSGEGPAATTRSKTQAGGSFVYTFTGPAEGLPGYSIEINTVLSNYPGLGNEGTLTTKASFTAEPGAGAAPKLTVLAEVVDSISGNLIDFTSPTGNALFVRSDLTSVKGSATSGTAAGTTLANGLPVAVGPVTLGAPLVTAGGTTAGTSGYTLSNQLVFSGVSRGASSVSGTIASTVSVPEPSSLVLTGLVALGLGVGLRRRPRPRTRRTKPAR